MRNLPNLGLCTAAGFGDEWQRFDLQGMDPGEAERVFGDYFAIFPWDQLPPNGEGFNMGCGSGRWARGKCAFKLIQSLACAVPVVASPVGANLEAVTVSCGFLASALPSGWLPFVR